MFTLIMVILISVLVVGIEGVSSFITTLFSPVITLSIPYSNKGGYDGLSVALGIKPGAYNLGGSNLSAYSLSI